MNKLPTHLNANIYIYKIWHLRSWENYCPQEEKYQFSLDCNESTPRENLNDNTFHLSHLGCDDQKSIKSENDETLKNYVIFIMISFLALLINSFNCIMGVKSFSAYLDYLKIRDLNFIKIFLYIKLMIHFSVKKTLSP